MSTSKELLERAQAEHVKCVERWQALFKRDPMAKPIYHSYEAHLPGKVTDLRKQ